MKGIKEKLGSRGIDRLENLIIVALVCLALFLIPRSGLSENVTGQGTGTGTESLVSGVQDTALSRGTPTRMVVQTGQGRFGIQYDQSQTEGLYRDGFDQLLLAAVEAMDTVTSATREDWQSALGQTGSWVYYDFLYNVSFTSQNSRGEGAGRLFLLTSRGGRVDTIYYYNDETQDYYQGQLRETLTLPRSLEVLSPNGARFAFEVPEVAQLLWANMVLLPQAALCPVYLAANPLAAMDESGRQALLETMDFNLRTAAVYEAADGDPGGVRHPPPADQRPPVLPRGRERPGPLSGPVGPGEGSADQSRGNPGGGDHGLAGRGRPALPEHPHPGGRAGGAHLLLPAQRHPGAAVGRGLGGPVRLFRQ